MYVIADIKLGMYVSRVSNQMIQFTTHGSYTKKFKTYKAAESFINKYSGTGYGLCKENCRIGASYF